MISLDDLCAVLNSLQIPWANEGFNENDKPEPPYISLEAGFEESTYADNASWARWMPYEILLYTAHRSYELERRIKKALDGAGCAFEKSVSHIDGERLIEACFTVNVAED